MKTAEPQNKEPQNIEVKNIYLFFSKTSAVSAEGGFDIRYSKYKSNSRTAFKRGF
jgi:hypothetical protein